MQFDCSRKEFADAVGMAAEAASTRTSLPILQTVKLEAGDGRVRVVGCDGEMWVEREVPAMVSEPGAVCLQARTLNDIVHSLADGDVNLRTLDGQGALLSQGASEYRLAAMDASDFPEPPDYGGEGVLGLAINDLRAAVDSVLYAVSSDPHRQVLTGVMFHYADGKLTLAATDTHRLAVRILEQPGEGTSLSAVVPEKALKAIKGLPLDGDDKVELRFGNGRMGVEAAGAKVVAQLIVGAFPSWERVVPNETTRTWKVEVDQLSEKVKRAMILARDNANRLRFKGDGEEITIFAKSEERGEAKEEVAMVASNGDIEVAFNGKYVMDAISAVQGLGVVIEMTENTRPAVFRPADDAHGYFCVIMPMQLN